MDSDTLAFLKDHLKIAIEEKGDSYGKSVYVRLILDGEVISEDYLWVPDPN